MRLLLTLFAILTLSASPVYAEHGNGEETDAAHSHAAFESEIQHYLSKRERKVLYRFFTSIRT